jgi:hypothetical protein
MSERDLFSQAWDEVNGPPIPMSEDFREPIIEQLLPIIERFAHLVRMEAVGQEMQRNPAFARAMDEYYESKWAHRFD